LANGVYEFGGWTLRFSATKVEIRSGATSLVAQRGLEDFTYNDKPLPPENVTSSPLRNDTRLRFDAHWEGANYGDWTIFAGPATSEVVLANQKSGRIVLLSLSSNAMFYRDLEKAWMHMEDRNAPREAGGLGLCNLDGYLNRKPQVHLDKATHYATKTIVVGDNDLVVKNSDRTVLFSVAPNSSDFYWNGKIFSLSRPAPFEPFKLVNNFSVRPHSMALSSDGKVLATTGGDFAFTVHLWNTETGEKLRTYTGHTNPVSQVAFSNDGTILASTSMSEKSAKVWSAKNAADVKTISGPSWHPNGAVGLALSGDGTMLATVADDFTVKLWNARTGGLIKTLTNNKRNTADGVLMSANGKTFVTWGRYDRTVDVWSVDTGKVIQTFLKVSSNPSLTSDGKLLAAAAGKTVTIWNTQTGAEQKSLLDSDTISRVAISGDGKTLATADSYGAVRIWNVTAGTSMILPAGISLKQHALQLSHDGKLLALINRKGSVDVWNLANGDAPDANPPDVKMAPNADLSRLQGSWNATTPPNLNDDRVGMTFTGDTIILELIIGGNRKELARGKCKTRPWIQNGVFIDMIQREGNGENTIYVGTAKFVGTKLEMSFSGNPKLPAHVRGINYLEFAKATNPGAKGEVDPNRNPRVVVKTTEGQFVIELYPNKAPVTVKNFLQYVDDGYYDGTIFHRVIREFMIQGGGLTPKLDEKTTRGPIKSESDNGLLNEIGAVTMARKSDPNSATSQFFINTKRNMDLDRATSLDKVGYTVFGKVVEGMIVVKKIELMPTQSRGSHSNVPIRSIVIESIRRLDDVEPMPPPKAPVIDEKATAADKAALQGVWIGVSGEAIGMALPADVVKSMRMEFNGNVATFSDTSGKKSNDKSTFRLDPTKTPKLIEFIDGSSKGVKGSYELKNNQLTLRLEVAQPTGQSISMTIVMRRQ
jgi:peptidyl-prolyl cis-trans isomerase A (cyclophilin A)